MTGGEIPSHDTMLTEIGTITLEKVKFACAAHVSSAVLYDMDVEVVADYLAGDFSRAVLRMLVPGKVTTETVAGGTEHVPITWWDHFKKTVGLKRYNTRPIVTRIENRTINVCPHLNIASRGPHFSFLTMDAYPERRTI